MDALEQLVPILHCASTNHANRANDDPLDLLVEWLRLL